MSTTDARDFKYPVAYWFRTVNHLMATRVAEAFECEGTSRREWKVLDAIDGTTEAPDPRHAQTVSALIERGWVTTNDNDEWVLTDEGHAAKERLDDVIGRLHDTAAGAVTKDELDITGVALEKIARALGWETNTPLPPLGGLAREARSS